LTIKTLHVPSSTRPSSSIASITKAGAGTLNLQRSRQGWPVVFQASESDQGRASGAAIAEGIYSNAESFERAKEYYADVKGRVAALGRNPDHILILPGLISIIADTDEAARAIEEEQNGRLDLAKALVQPDRPFNYHNFAQYELDTPFPDASHLTLNSYAQAGFALSRCQSAPRLDPDPGATQELELVQKRFVLVGFRSAPTGAPAESIVSMLL
jgi:alkanesulfonate monooxygenase SsuD/methylene tetrahydromethanopterin reductase-like flavin-dependent oxidoreductase (luciferase family)